MPSVYARGHVATKANRTGLNATTGVTTAWWQFVMPQESAAFSGDVFRQSSTANVSRDGYVIFWNAGALGFRSASATGSTDTSFSAALAGSHARGQWMHCTVAFDNAADTVWFYRNGMLVGRAANTRDMTSNASCTTDLLGTALQGTLFSMLFDLQVFPDVVVPPSDIRLLMNPAVQYPNCKGRYCGLQFRSVASSTTDGVRDESGNGNHLDSTALSTGAPQAAEPPLSPTLA